MPTAFRRIDPEALRRARERSGLAFETTAELEDLPVALGQARALEAIGFGIAVRQPGYNLYAMGPEGVGRRTAINRALLEQATARPAPDDWCYVFDFQAPHRPRRLRLPAGAAPGFKADVDRLVEELRLGIPAAFETDEYRSRRQELETEFGERQEQGIGAVGAHAREQGIALLRTPGGFGFAPMEGDGVMAPERFHQLPEPERKRIESAIEALQKELEQVLEQVPRWRREAQHKLRELNRQVTHGVVNSLIREVQEKWRAIPAAFEHLDALREDVLDHAELFQQPKDGEVPPFLGMIMARAEGGESRLLRYQVNVLVHNDPTAGAPIVYEDHPTHDNLVGRIEHESRLGALETDFTHIKGGALHRANGGYLLVDALKVLREPLAWEALKRALRSAEIRTESLAQAIGLISTTSLEPEPIPLDVKVVLIGQRRLYYLLHAFDPEFGELFKVMADFEEDMRRAPEADALYARLVATVARSKGLRPLERGAVARVIDAAARRAADGERLSVEIAPLVDLLVEADHRAGTAAATTAAHVAQAIAAQERRADRVRGRIREEMLRGTLLVATGGERAGQVNGLWVARMGGFSFGMPARITATVRLGGGTVIDIERESDLGGPTHSKGVLILSGFIAGRYVPGRALSLAASLVFEQSYGGVDGDSASSAELYALLSALADAPIRQSLAVTGSVNQHGDVQAVGGVSEKVEGFFDLCASRGLTGEQGVLIPASNVPHLVLREDVMAAVEAGTFHLYAIETIDQGLEVLTGTPAGERDGVGGYPAGSLNARIEARLADFAERSRAAALPRRMRRRPQRREPGE